jgi:hypothetical protein
LTDSPTCFACPECGELASLGTLRRPDFRDNWLEIARASSSVTQDNLARCTIGYIYPVDGGIGNGSDSQRGIAWRFADSLSLKAFLGDGPTKSTPDHSLLTKIRERLPVELYAEVFQFVLKLVERHKLLSATVVGVEQIRSAPPVVATALLRSSTGKAQYPSAANTMGPAPPDRALERRTRQCPRLFPCHTFNSSIATTLLATALEFAEWAAR